MQPGTFPVEAVDSTNWSSCGNGDLPPKYDVDMSLVQASNWNLWAFWSLTRLLLFTCHLQTVQFKGVDICGPSSICGRKMQLEAKSTRVIYVMKKLPLCRSKVSSYSLIPSCKPEASHNLILCCRLRMSWKHLVHPVWLPMILLDTGIRMNCSKAKQEVDAEIVTWKRKWGTTERLEWRWTYHILTFESSCR